MSDVIVDKAAVDKLAADTESKARTIDGAPRPDVTALVAAAMPDSPLVAASATATESLRKATTAMSGQWETMASVVRAVRAGTTEVDVANAAKLRAMGALPTGVPHR